MNWDKLRKLEYTHVKIRPPARLFTDESLTRELPPTDGDWFIGHIYDKKSIPISYNDWGLSLGHDHIHGWTSDPIRGERHGFLTLTVQLFLGGKRAKIEPGVRPSGPSN